MKLEGKETDLGGGMIVHRILPRRQKRMIGPFCFLDHMGPISAPPSQNTDVPPHPHIGLSTLTYLFSGRAVHRDSLGTEAVINPGDVNWMTAGRGISHSERTHPDDKSKIRNLEGLQFWVALPNGMEDTAPNFEHYEFGVIPSTENQNSRITVVAGTGFGLVSPVKTSSPLVLMVIDAKKDFQFEFTEGAFEFGFYVAQGSAVYADEKVLKNQMFVFENGIIPSITVAAGSRIVILGGKPFSTPRYMWWNLVSSSREKIEEAKQAWRTGTFPMVPGETEHIPLPEF